MTPICLAVCPLRTATPPLSPTDPPLSSAAPQSSGTPVQQTRSNDPLSSSTATSSSTTSSVGITPSSTDVTPSLVGASSQVSNTDNPTSIATTKASSLTHQRPNATALPSNVTTPSTNTSSQSAWTTLATTGGSLNTTQYHFGNLSTPFPGISGTSPVPLVASFSSKFLCNASDKINYESNPVNITTIYLNYCPIILKCSFFDYRIFIQITEFTFSSKVKYTYAFNIFSYLFLYVCILGRCSSNPPLCCLGLNNSCFRGCFCDVACIRLKDCCPDFQTTCVTGIAGPLFYHLCFYGGP